MSLFFFFFSLSLPRGAWSGSPADRVTRFDPILRTTFVTENARLKQESRRTDRGGARRGEAEVGRKSRTSFLSTVLTTP